MGGPLPEAAGLRPDGPEPGCEECSQPPLAYPSVTEWCRTHQLGFAGSPSPPRSAGSYLFFRPIAQPFRGTCRGALLFIRYAAYLQLLRSFATCTRSCGTTLCSFRLLPCAWPAEVSCNASPVTR